MCDPLGFVCVSPLFKQLEWGTGILPGAKRCLSLVCVFRASLDAAQAALVAMLLP